MNDLEKVIRAMADREREFEAATLDLVEKEHAHKVQRAIEYLKADGTIKDKEAIAEERCAGVYLERLKAEARASIAKEKLLDSRAVLSARQTILTNQTRINQATQYS